ncbi:MAG: dinitrogenase iron-molybdenum cofactor [Desulfobacteraceae bacterium]|nr:MAG: dinitrogenase iron-molybdenum cofactor [Desulfobacteraceae bacterium]
MIVAVPIDKNQGLESAIYDHFGMAKEFLVINTASNTITTIPNNKRDDPSSHCKASRFTKTHNVDTIITSCIGNGQLRNLTSANIKVFKANPGTVSANLEQLKKDELKPFHMLDICRGERHKKDGGCGHHH